MASSVVGVDLHEGLVRPLGIHAWKQTAISNAVLLEPVGKSAAHMTRPVHPRPGSLKRTMPSAIIRADHMAIAGRGCSSKSRVTVSKDFDERVEALAKLMFRARHMVLFTGAGISTESGLSDFRGPDGLWTRRDKGLPPPRMGVQWHLVPPNSGHLAIVELQNIGKLKFLISQNVDNLHVKSGIHPELLAELHGNITRLRCTNCGSMYDRSSGLRSCRCGGALTSRDRGFWPASAGAGFDALF